MNREIHFLQQLDLQKLIDSLISGGYECIGPQVRDGTIVYAPLHSCAQLPRGISDQQSPGHYRLVESTSGRYFDWANGPQAIKPYAFTPRESLWHSSRNAEDNIHFSQAVPEVKATAIFGARACDIAALKLQDQHFLHSSPIDPAYQARREQLLIIAVNCRKPADTCFCYSTGDGPFINDSHSDITDIILTELDDGFLIQACSTQGESMLQTLPLNTATTEQLEQHISIHQSACEQSRKLPDADIKTELFNRLDHTAWNDIAARCLSCGNCTSVCPSCFCFSEQDNPSLDGNTVEHFREWDSCFTQGHSYIHGITIRADTEQRYRQWLTHKFSGWIDQYGRSGCVGCGRCISWCPVGIDVIESIEQVLEMTDE